MPFNPEQEQVLSLTDGNILLTAPAGCGKTTVLAHRIQQILSRGLAAPKEILCITFTNKACREMGQRISDVNGKAGEGVIIKTIHGFCFDVLKEQARRTDIFRDFMIFDEEDCIECVKQLLPPGRGLNPSTVAGFIYTIKHQQAEQDIPPDAPFLSVQASIRRYIEEKPGEFYDKVRDVNIRSYLRQEGAGLMLRYQNCLREQHGLDFADLIISVFWLFKDPAIRALYKKRFRYINVDEIQDTSLLEYRLLSSIFTENILLCGDVNQTIYEWRGSEPHAIIRHFTDMYQPVLIQLKINYRQTAALQRYAAAFIGQAQTLTLPAGIEEGSPPSFYSAKDIDDEAAAIYRQIKKLRAADSNSEICILARTNPYNHNLSQALSKQVAADEPSAAQGRIRFSLSEEYRFFRRKEVKELLAFGKLLLNPRDERSFIRIAESYIQQIGQAALKELTESPAFRFTDLLFASTWATGDYYGMLFAENKPVILFDVESTGTNVLQDDIIQIAAIRMDLQGNIQEEFTAFLHTDKPLGDSADVHGFTEAFLREKGEEPSAVLKRFIAFLGEDIVIGHNVSFDLSILENQIRRLGITGYSAPRSYDTLEIYRRFYPGLPNHKLGFLAEHFSITHKPSHNALDDILATRELLMLAIKQHIAQTAGERQALFKKYADRFAAFWDFLNSLKARLPHERPEALFQSIIKNYAMWTRYEKQEELQRIDNQKRFLSLAETLTKGLPPEAAMERVLYFSSLSNSELDILLKKDGQIPVITVHQAKGLEFDHVFIAGLAKGILPLYTARDLRRMNEEKRIFYVAITRSKKSLYMSFPTFYNDRCQLVSPFIQVR